MRPNPSQRFWAKVDRSGDCWVWTACRFVNRRGVPDYGAFQFEGRLQHAQRVAWVLTNGPIPEGLFVLHSCDNPPCVRPAHLSLGTHRKNMDQMVARLRYTHGTAHHSNRLTPDQVREIRIAIANGDPLPTIAAKYGVTTAAIWLIRSGKNWKWLDAA